MQPHGYKKLNERLADIDSHFYIDYIDKWDDTRTILCILFHDDNTNRNTIIYDLTNGRYYDGFRKLPYLYKKLITHLVNSFTIKDDGSLIFDDVATKKDNNDHNHKLNNAAAKQPKNPFESYTDKLADTLLSKNKAYGDSFAKSVDKYGLSVIGICLSGKYNRLEHLITNDELKENDESLEDTLLDMAGYSILGLKYLKEHKK